jgi:hypothetical protein
MLAQSSCVRWLFCPSWRPFRSRLLFSHSQTLFDVRCVLWYIYIKMMIHRGNGPLASRLRQRKFQLLRRFSIPADALPGSLSLSHLRCGKPSCHCADDRGHPVWSLTFMVQGKKQVQHIPKDWVEEVRRRVKAGREFQDAVREVLAANAQLLVLERKKPKKK